MSDNEKDRKIKALEWKVAKLEAQKRRLCELLVDLGINPAIAF